MAIEATIDHAWTGWARRNSYCPWRPAVQAQSEAEAWVLLLAHVAGGDKCVLPAGKDPNQRRHPTRT